MDNEFANGNDAISFLRDEQRALRQHFYTFEELRRGASKRYDKLFAAQETCSALKMHLCLCADHLYPVVRLNGADADLLNAAHAAHLSAAALVAEIDALTPDDPDFDTRFSILANYVDGHMQCELGLLFRCLGQMRIDSVALGRTLRERKEELLRENVSVVGDD